MHHEMVKSAQIIYTWQIRSLLRVLLRGEIENLCNLCSKSRNFSHFMLLVNIMLKITGCLILYGFSKHYKKSLKTVNNSWLDSWRWEILKKTVKNDSKPSVKGTNQLTKQLKIWIFWKKLPKLAQNKLFRGLNQFKTAETSDKSLKKQLWNPDSCQNLSGHPV